MMALVYKVELMDHMLEEIAKTCLLLPVDSPRYDQLRRIYNLAEIGREKWLKTQSEPAYASWPPSVAGDNLV